MIIWRGWGILAAIIPFGMLIITELISEAVSGMVDYYQQNSGWLVLLGLLVSSLILWPLGRRLNDRSRAYTDRETGQQIAVRPNHQLFFIKMEYWAIILPILGAALVLSE